MCPLHCFYVFNYVCITCGIRKRTKYHLRGEFSTQLSLACQCVSEAVLRIPRANRNTADSVPWIVPWGMVREWTEVG